MDIVIDTDIISAFGKIREYDLLIKLFPQSRIFVSPRVYQDLIAAKELGYTFVESILNYNPEICPLNQKENEEARKLKEKERSLGWGEIESIILAKNRGFILLTNDKKAIRTASNLKIDYFNLPMLLRQFWKQHILSKDEVTKILREIEEKDRVFLVNKSQLFED